MLHYVKLSSNAKYLITTEFEKIVHVWDFVNKRKLYTLKTSFCTSSERFAISNDETTFVSCKWDKKSIILHNLIDGSKIWENKLINHIHSLTFSADGQFIYVRNEDVFYVLDVSDGKIIRKEKGDITRFDVHDNGFSVIIKNKMYCIYLNEQMITSVPLKTFACLDLAFSDRYFYVSEAGGELRCISLENGKELWVHKPKKGEHFLKICYNNAHDIVYALLFVYEKTTADKIHVFNATNGEVITIIDLEHRYIDYSFDREGKYFVATNGDIYHLNLDKSKIIKDRIELVKSDSIAKKLTSSLNRLYQTICK